MQGELFVKLLEVMVESVLLYGAEVCGCYKRMEALFRAGAVESSQDLSRGWAAAPKSGPPV